MTLRLAADLFQRTPRDERQSLLLAGAEQEVIQGQLYRRILRHLHDERIRKLAHPGLVVRRITPEVIAEVLAGPCNVILQSPDEADELFTKFRNEVSLVTQAEDGSLHHRPDVRKVMLKFLLQDDPVRVRAIHENAIRYYSEKEDIISRAEELYHRLALPDAYDVIDSRWIDGIESYLRNSVGELPLESQRFLARRLDIELTEKIWTSATRIEQERVVANQATALLESGRAGEVIEFLSSRAALVEQSASLILLEAHAYAALKKSKLAIAAGKKALRGAELNNDRELRLRAAAFLAACYTQIREARLAHAYYRQAFELANILKDPIRALEIALSAALVTINKRSKEYKRLTAAVNNLISTIEPERLAAQRSLVFDLAASFGSTDPVLLRVLIARYGISAVRVRQLAAAFSTWDRELSKKSRQKWPLARSVGLSSRTARTNPWPKYVNQ